MAKLMLAYTPFHLMGLLNLADDILSRNPSESIDVVVVTARPGMAEAAEGLKKLGAFRRVWTPRSAKPLRVKSLRRYWPRLSNFLLKFKFVWLSVLFTVGVRSAELQEAFLRVQCQGIDLEDYEELYTAVSDSEVVALVERQNPSVQIHLFEDGYVTWMGLINSPEKFSSHIIHLIEPEVLPEGLELKKVRRMPGFSEGRTKLRDWLRVTFQELLPESINEKPADHLVFDQTMGSGVFRTSHRNDAHEKQLEARLTFLKSMKDQAEISGEVLEIRAHPYSSERELVEVSERIGFPIKRANGLPYELELVLGLSTVPQKVSSISSTAAFTWLLMLGMNDYEVNVHFYWDYYRDKVGTKMDASAVFMDIVLRLNKKYPGVFHLHDDLPT